MDGISFRELVVFKKALVLMDRRWMDFKVKKCLGSI